MASERSARTEDRRVARAEARATTAENRRRRAEASASASSRRAEASASASSRRAEASASASSRRAEASASAESMETQGMSTPTQPTPAPGKKLNRIGLEPVAYRGSKTTLCAGCGHNAITERIIDSFWELGISPDQVLKLSGIGCSSKSPAYFLNQSHGFNSVHGRMPSVATGAVVANRKMIAIGVSGDGDTGAIGKIGRAHV